MNLPRSGFVHEFRPLTPEDMRLLLERHWAPVGVSLLESTFTPEVVARLIRSRAEPMSPYETADSDLMIRSEALIEQIPHEVLSLSKLNLNDTQFDGGELITLRAARRVGDILKCIPDTGTVQPSFRFFN